MHVSAGEMDALRKEKASREMDAALAESLAYEESRAEEAAMRRLRLKESQERQKAAYRKLNEATLAKVVSGMARDSSGDARAFLAKTLKDYEANADRLGFSRSALSKDRPLCPSCKAFHGLEEWEGLCSRCHVLAESSGVVAMTTCAPSFVKAKFSRVFGRRERRRNLPAVPSETVVVSRRKLLERRVAALGREGYDVEADGACQFRSVAHQLWDNEKHHSIVRERVVAYLADHPPAIHDCEVYVSTKRREVDVKAVGEDLNAYLAAMKLDTSWGDATTLKACADVFRVRILLVTTFDDNFELEIEPTLPAVREIWIGFYAEMHYISLTPLK